MATENTVPARCERCGRPFSGRGGIHIEGDTSGWTLAGNSLPCPYPGCGGRGWLLEGTFNIRGGEFELLDGPVWSHELLEELQLAFNAIVADPPADPIAPVERLSPSLGRDLRRVTRGWTTERILHLMASIGGILAFAGVDAHDVMQWVAWYLETVERHPHM